MRIRAVSLILGFIPILMLSVIIHVLTSPVDYPVWPDRFRHFDGAKYQVVASPTRLNDRLSIFTYPEDAISNEN